MTPLRQRLIQDLQLRNYSPRTVQAYVHHAARFAKHFGRSPELLGPEQAREYQLHLLGQKASWSRYNQAVAALRFLYSVTLRRPELVPMLPYGKRPRRVPCVLSQQEVLRLFDAAADPPFRVLLQTTYACGLRAGEVLRLRLTDLDSGRMVVQVRQGKGRKDRLVPLSPALLGLLRDYWRQHRPREWLFPGRTPAGHRSVGQVQRLCRRAVLAAGISKRASLHTLRHSYATHLLEAGVDLLSLQKLLGRRPGVHHRAVHPRAAVALAQGPQPFGYSAGAARPAGAPAVPAVPRAGARLDVGAALRRHGAAARAACGPLTSERRRALRDLGACRTAALGGRVERCPACLRQDYLYNSCRNRHCPKCQAAQRAAWLEREAGCLLPVEYHHLVFTLPAALAPLALCNPRAVYGLLFEAAAAAVRELAADPKYLGAQVGLVAVLHAWGQTLSLHPHVHLLASGGGLSCDRRGEVDPSPCWRSCRPGFFLPVRALGRLFRGKFLAGLRQAHALGKLLLPAELAGPGRWGAWLAELYRRDWVMHSQPPCAGPEVVLKYLARYVRRAAVSDGRVVAVTDESVTFSYKDYRCRGKQKQMTPAGPEFVRRLLQHVLPRGFVRVRHYGLLANRGRAEKLALARRLLGQAQQATAETAETAGSAEPGPRCCPSCGEGAMVLVQVLGRQPAGAACGAGEAPDTS